MADEDDPKHGESAILREHFGRYWRAWRWVRRQFSATSLATIGAVIVGCGGWILSLKTRVVVLETQVVPVLKSEDRLAKVEGAVIAHDARIGSMERNYEYAKQEAGTAPTGKKGARK